MKVLDCFTFYNEIDMLKYRLDTLNAVVDKFILVEADKTFVGNPKPLYYDMYKDSVFSKYKDKIEHIIIKLHKTSEAIARGESSAWDNEKQQRDYLTYGIEACCTDDSDIIFLSDVDEIVDPTLIQSIKNEPTTLTVANIQQDLYYYNSTCRFKMKWLRPKVFTYKYFKETSLSLDEIRLSEPSISLPRGGWHLSYFGDLTFIQNKIRNFSHTEHNTEECTSAEYIQSCIKNTQSIFKGYDTEYISPEYNSYPPPNIQLYFPI